LISKPKDLISFLVFSKSLCSAVFYFFIEPTSILSLSTLDGLLMPDLLVKLVSYSSTADNVLLLDFFNFLIFFLTFFCSAYLVFL
jgi:hypothetical protein